MCQRYGRVPAEEAAEAAAEAAQLKAQLTAPPGLLAVEKTDATVAVVTPPPSESGEEHPLEEAGDVPVTAGFLGYGAACKLADPRTCEEPWYLALKLESETIGCTYVGETPIYEEIDACLDVIEAEQAAAAAVAAEAIRTAAREHECEKAQEPPKAARGAGDVRKRAALTLACAFRSALARRRVARPAAKRAGRRRRKDAKKARLAAITPGPSLRTMLSGPQDWSFGGEAKTSCVVPPPHGAKAPSPNGTWVSARGQLLY